MLGAGLPSVNPVLGAGLPSVNPVLGAGLPSINAGRRIAFRKSCAGRRIVPSLHQQARVLYRGEARHPEWRRFDACSGASDLRKTGGAPGSAAGGARGAAEVVRGAQPGGVQGLAPGRLGARDFFEAAEGEKVKIDFKWLLYIHIYMCALCFHKY